MVISWPVECIRHVHAYLAVFRTKAPGDHKYRFTNLMNGNLSALTKSMALFF